MKEEDIYIAKFNSFGRVFFRNAKFVYLILLVLFFVLPKDASTVVAVILVALLITQNIFFPKPLSCPKCHAINRLGFYGSGYVVHNFFFGWFRKYVVKNIEQDGKCWNCGVKLLLKKEY